MSFILDALRKSDQQRQRSATPTLTSIQAPTAPARQPALWWYGVLAAVLVGAGILIGWMHQWQSEPPTPSAPPIASKLPEVGLPKPLPPPVPLASTALPPVAAVAPTLPATKPEPLPREPVAPAPQKLAAAPAAPAPSTLPATPAAPASPAAKTEERPAGSDSAKDPGVIGMAELPPLLQQELPKLNILAHSYSSKPKSRFVYINDRMWHEEESPAPGLKLEQITPDGMIFSYKGYRFRRGANL